MPKLSRLLVDIHDGMNWDFHPDFYIKLPKLEELGVRFTTEVEDQFNEVPFEFLNNIYCPHLKDLSITCDYPDKPEERSGFDFHVAPIGFYVFLRDNGSELERLVIGYDLFSETEFLNALVRCTNLRQLHFRICVSRTIRSSSRSSIWNDDWNGVLYRLARIFHAHTARSWNVL